MQFDNKNDQENSLGSWGKWFAKWVGIGIKKVMTPEHSPTKGRIHEFNGYIDRVPYLSYLTKTLSYNV